MRCFRDAQGRPVRVLDAGPEVLGPDGTWSPVMLDVDGDDVVAVSPERFDSDCRVYVALGLAGLDR